MFTSPEQGIDLQLLRRKQWRRCDRCGTVIYGYLNKRYCSKGTTCYNIRRANRRNKHRQRTVL